ncbi:MAG: flagellar basal body rod protein FlgF [Gammaproteobacteria bacterium]|jgi:flagellar basal-body rod protein FlgF
MDDLVYVAMTGLRQAEKLQTVISHNIANASTIGFRAEIPVFSSEQIFGDGLESRVNTLQVDAEWNDSSGSMMPTGRELDVAIRGSGWFAVQDADGNEAYTRAGSFRLSPTGVLETHNGHLVLSEGGPITVPEYQKVYVGGDGLISIIPVGQKANTLVEAERIKLVNPARDQIARGADGLFRPVDGLPLLADASVQVVSGQLESSNVNVAESLVQMIELARHFETQVRALREAEQTDASAASVMQINS